MQSRLMSLAEAVTNILVGYGIAVLTQITVFPLFGLHASFSENLVIGLIFTCVSLIRGYTLRRLFNSRVPSRDAEHACSGDGLTAVDIQRLHR
jgi:hypothetical protein